MSMKIALTTAAILVGLTSGAAQAAVIRVDFAMLDDASATVASGNFTYDDGLTGSVIGYGDLGSFFLSTSVDSYDLSFLIGGTFTEFYGMAYNTATQSFNTLSASGFPWILAAILDDFSDGFLIRPSDDFPVVGDYPESGVTGQGRPYTSIRVDVSQVPVPAALPLLASGLGALGFVGWRRKRKEKLAAA